MVKKNNNNYEIFNLKIVYKFYLFSKIFFIFFQFLNIFLCVNAACIENIKNYEFLRFHYYFGFVSDFFHFKKQISELKKKFFKFLRIFAF
jgi:hypothetical protein